MGDAGLLGIADGHPDRLSGHSQGQMAAQTALTRPGTATNRQPPDPAPPCDFGAPYQEACLG
ncbi:hypothetical protein [Kitasatospora sp. NPDC017646]|uniref:hypothetical protein n=1 Tax=Kitasatospora sp. NPDC017646 TaxID=3364024 RepID=UPI0037941C41